MVWCVEVVEVFKGGEDCLLEGYLGGMSGGVEVICV